MTPDNVRPLERHLIAFQAEMLSDIDVVFDREGLSALRETGLVDRIARHLVRSGWRKVADADRDPIPG